MAQTMFVQRIGRFATQQSFATNGVQLSQTLRPISTSFALFGDPVKKKKKMDPEAFKLRVERRVKKLDKEIRKLLKTKKQLKPLVEYQLPPQIMKNLEARKRNEDELKAAEEDFDKIGYLCSFYRQQQVDQERVSFENVVRSQSKALKHLRLISEELYNAAISSDNNFIPFEDNKIVKVTSPVKDYTPPDGQKRDVTKEWKM